MLKRIYLGPYMVGKVELTYYKGEIKRGQEIQVTPEEAAAMDKLPRQWKNPEITVSGYKMDAGKGFTWDEASKIEVKKKTKKRTRKTRKRKEGK